MKKQSKLYDLILNDLCQEVHADIKAETKAEQKLAKLSQYEALKAEYEEQTKLLKDAAQNLFLQFDAMKQERRLASKNYNPDYYLFPSHHLSGNVNALDFKTVREGKLFFENEHGYDNSFTLPLSYLTDPDWKNKVLAEWAEFDKELAKKNAVLKEQESKRLANEELSRARKEKRELAKLIEKYPELARKRTAKI